MTPEPAAPAPRRRWRIARWFVLATFLACAYGTWRVHDLRAAGKEAEALGWFWLYDDPFDAIDKDWKAVFRKATWAEGKRNLTIPHAGELERHKRLLHRLSPRHVGLMDSGDVRVLSTLKGLPRLKKLLIYDFPKLTNLDALKELSKVDFLALEDCPELTNVDGLKALPELRDLSLIGCTTLANLDALKGLSGLQKLRLDYCTELVSVDVLAGLSGLQDLSLQGCRRLTNVDVLKGLTGLKRLDLFRCTGLSAEAIASLRAALPNTNISADK